MEWLETIVLVVHVLVSVGLIGLVLLQQGKGADAGASFGGGASQTVFGSQGTGNFLTKTTSLLAFVFFVTSFSLAVFAKQQSKVMVDQGIAVPSVSEPVSEEVEFEAPQLETQEEGSVTPELE
ncbi:preprotein translocase subunit SecG [Alkalimarinus sediminis]|uniref:Protein-export membrane protein SecG n=1 Tax=Alkalimarinus sediminis TaxID=1632866 RepID=A0A9E8HHC6_9ALTE|nr:preprotein translocase subunit SecG [Alkalimarinus sediminis]UZW74207.1 preprotein translocase subunit SecG [Alkalimarinus sediminis]